MRMIDADALFAEFENADWYNNADRDEIAERLVLQAPTIDAVSEWIPCSERLPKKVEATYLICTETGYMCSCRWTNDMYGLGATEWSKWGWHIMDKPQYAKVVAWMPLPKPYGERKGE